MKQKIGMKAVHAWYGGTLLILGSMASCLGTTGRSMSNGGELTGISTTTTWNEPTPYGMALVKRGSVIMGPEEQDTLW